MLVISCDVACLARSCEVVSRGGNLVQKTPPTEQADLSIESPTCTDHKDISDTLLADYDEYSLRGFEWIIIID